MLQSAASLKQTGGRELAGIVFDEATIAARVRRFWLTRPVSTGGSEMAGETA